MSTASTSLINGGQPDGICAGSSLPGDGQRPPEGVSASHPAFDGAPAYYEVGMPSGDYAGQEPRGVMLVIHGGGWSFIGPGGVLAARPAADRWRARGWQTVNLSYRSCGRSVNDVRWFYDRARAYFGDQARMCASGFSAGGHLALLLAASRPGVHCVVSEGGPTDLGSVRGQTAADQSVGPLLLYNLATSAFGEENLRSVSPVAQVSPNLSNTRVLLGLAAGDWLVPYQQATGLRQALLAANPNAYVDTVRLEGGSAPFTHGGVSQAALNDFFAREQRLVGSRSRRRPALP